MDGKEQMSFWKHYPKITATAATSLGASLFLLITKPNILAWGNNLVEPFLVIIALCSMATFFVLIFILERRKKYSIIVTLAGFLLVFSIISVALDLLLDYLAV